MATYKGGEIPVEDQTEKDLKLRGKPLPGMENIEEELNLWEEAGPDRTPMPGQKGYRTKDVIANRDATRGQFRSGGPTKQADFAAGGPKLNTKSYSK